MVVQWGNCQLLGKVGGGTVVLRPNNFKDEELEDYATAYSYHQGKMLNYATL